MTLPEKLKTMRLVLGRSQADTAKILKVSIETYSRWERGVVTPRKMYMGPINTLVAYAAGIQRSSEHIGFRK